MVTDRRESGSYWNDEGAEFLALIIGSVVLYEPPENRSLPFIYKVIRDVPEALQTRLEGIRNQGHPALRYEAERFWGIIEHAPPQWQGIVSKAALATKRYAPSTPLGKHVSEDGFDAADLKRKDVTVYILVPAGQLPNALPLMNTLMGVFGTAIGRPGRARPVTLLIDDALSLGYMPDLIPFMAQFRKVGLRVWLFTQTVAQLAAPELYGDAGFRTISGMVSVKQFFSVREKETAQMVSDMAGQRTARNVSNNPGGEAVNDVGVPLVRPDLVRALPKWRQIITLDGPANRVRTIPIPISYRADWHPQTENLPQKKRITSGRSCVPQ